MFCSLRPLPMDESQKLHLTSNMSLIMSLLFLFFLSNCISPTTAKIYPAVVPSVSEERSPPSSANGSLLTYIVHVRQPPASPSFSTFEERENWYKSFLPTSTDSLAESRLIYSYRSIVSGFAARLTEEELVDLKKRPGFVHAYPDRIVPLQTTRSPDFLGLHQETAGFWNDSNFGKGVIVGVLDTGVSPNLPSFSGVGMPPPPAKWKGVCEFNASDCNNKLIGARNFVQGSNAMRGSASTRAAANGPYDDDGHGTHTASTAAGMFVKNANVDGQANGTATGMAPFAHLAIYKVCTEQDCADSDILAGMDTAVEDGVDVLSLSLAGPSQPFYSDGIAIGSFGAIEKGIFVSCAAGNNGPSYNTTSNEAPWILTVGASTMDRSIQTTVELGIKAEFNGESAYQPKGFRSELLPLVYPGFTGASDTFCTNGSLNGIDVKGKVVLCDDGNIDRIVKGEIVKSAGGAAMIIANFQAEGVTTFSFPHVLPASHVSFTDGLNIKSYINSSRSPTAAIAFKGTQIGTSPAPVVASFSSRGPNQADPNILKPDIIGPGVNILAAWPFKVGSNTATKLNIISGTSMATPHLSGIAALLKSAHPDWSPAAIKSAIMTTAYVKANDGSRIPDQSLNPADFFAIGAGHVDPSKASNPGLIYDINSDNYIAYLCGLQYTDRQISAIARRSIKCSQIRRISGSELNYPSFMLSLSPSNNYTVVVTRTVTNVGAPSSAYTVQISPPIGASVSVKPQQLVFSKANENAQFSVTFTGQSSSSTGNTSYSEGYLTWVSSDKSITVNSPIMVAVR